MYLSMHEGNKWKKSILLLLVMLLRISPKEDLI